MGRGTPGEAGEAGRRKIGSESPKVACKKKVEKHQLKTGSWICFDDKNCCTCVDVQLDTCNVSIMAWFG